jgi:hypothetical protein
MSEELEPKRLLARIEQGTADLLGRPLSDLPIRLRAVLVQAALVLGGIALGVLINREIAWILLFVVLTVLILVAIGGAYATRPSAEPRKPGTLSVSVPKDPAPHGTTAGATDRHPSGESRTIQDRNATSAGEARRQGSGGDP